MPKPVECIGCLVLSLCDKSGVMVEPWLEYGYTCMIVDIQHPRGITKKDNLYIVGADLNYWIPPIATYKIVFAFPPCTHLAVSGARWYMDKGLRALSDGLNLVDRCKRLCEWSTAPYMIENPVGQISSYWRKPDTIFDPSDYAGYLDNTNEDAYTKATCLWVGGGFLIPPHKPVVPEQGSKMHFIPPSDNRSDLRSLTPKGFARAVFEANYQVSTTRVVKIQC